MPDISHTSVGEVLQFIYLHFFRVGQLVHKLEIGAAAILSCREADAVLLKFVKVDFFAKQEGDVVIIREATCWIEGLKYCDGEETWELLCSAV